MDELILLNKFGNAGLILEEIVYSVARELSASDENPYDEGYWLSKEKVVDETIKLWTWELSKSDREWNLVYAENFSDITISTQGFSLLVFSMSLSRFTVVLTQIIETNNMLTENEKADLMSMLEEVCLIYKLINSYTNELLSKEDLEGFNKITD